MTDIEFKGKTYKVAKYSTWAVKKMLVRYGDEDALQTALTCNNSEIVLGEIIYLLGCDELHKDYPVEDDFLKAMDDFISRRAVITTAWQIIKDSIKFDLTPEEEKEAKLNKKKQKKNRSWFGFGKRV